MSVYLSKLLELVSVDRESNQSFLRIRLVGEEDVDLLWEIDHKTAENLKAATILDEVYKYRLSFHSSWDPVKNQYKSFLTKTYRDHSERIYFLCSDAYVNGLNSIRLNEKVRQIKKLTEIPIGLTLPDSSEKVVTPYKRSSQFGWIVAAVMSFIFIVLFIYSYVFNPVTTENAKVKAEFDNNEIQGDFGKKETVSEQTNIDSSGVVSNSIGDPNLPFVDLNETITFNIQKGNVALTFDDGPSQYTEEIIDVLKKHQVGGTFFFIGSNVKKYPDAVQYAHSNGYSIGSHSMNHLNFSRLSEEMQEYEILHTNQLIKDLIQEEVVLFRPPFGSKNEATIKIMNNTNSKMVLWNADTEDWKNQNSNTILDYVKRSKTSGSIILLHESPAVIDALPRIIEYLNQEDLDIVNLN